MEDEKKQINDFDPEMSEFNPIFAEINELREAKNEKEDEGFIASIIRRLSLPIVIETD